MHDVRLEDSAPSLLSAEDVERILGVDKSTVYRMAADGRLSAIKVGRQWRFPSDPLREMLASAGISPDTVSSARQADPGLDRGLIEPVVDLAAHLLGVMMVATDMEGNPVTAVANPCPWFSSHQDDPEVLSRCIDDWRGLAQGIDFEPHLTEGSHGFECARVYLREGSRLVGMILAGGVLPEDSDLPGMYRLDGESRERLLIALPRVATAVSRVISRNPSSTRSTP